MVGSSIAAAIHLVAICTTNGRHHLWMAEISMVFCSGFGGYLTLLTLLTLLLLLNYCNYSVLPDPLSTPIAQQYYVAGASHHRLYYSVGDALSESSHAFSRYSGSPAYHLDSSL